MDEQWKPIEGWPYEVSNLGQVRRSKRGQRGGPVGYILKPWYDGHGYPTVNLRDGGRWAVNIHKLVANAFLGPCPEGQETHHIDGNCLNNRSDNLVYVTRKSHMRQDHRSKLSEADIASCKKRFAAGEMIKDLAAEYGVHPSSLGRAMGRRAGMTRAGVTGGLLLRIPPLRPPQ